MLRKRRRKRGTVTRKFLFILLLAVAVVYVGGVFYYHSHFLRGTVIDRIDVSNMTVQDLLEQVQDYVRKYLADFKVPAYLHTFEEFPVNASGKVVTEQLKSAISERKKKVVKADGKLE